uniref:Uncharacterized protein n=1 Tax=Anguilla anguilla TaxID=7936 RepID=A0A0E9XSY6_ANGAN
MKCHKCNCFDKKSKII